jgi:hypothetical protein
VSLIGPPFGVPGLRPVRPPGVPGTEEQRRLVSRARSQARRWTVRAWLLLAVSALAFRYGWLPFGVVFAGLAALALQLAHSTRRRAKELAARLKALGDA